MSLKPFQSSVTALMNFGFYSPGGLELTVQIRLALSLHCSLLCLPPKGWDCRWVLTIAGPAILTNIYLFQELFFSVEDVKLLSVWYLDIKCKKAVWGLISPRFPVEFAGLSS